MGSGNFFYRRSMTVHFYPTSSSLSSSIAVHDVLRNGEEDYGEDRGIAAGRKLLFAGVLPS